MNCKAKKLCKHYLSGSVQQETIFFSLWHFIAVLLLPVPNTAWLSRTCTAVELKTHVASQTGVTWPKPERCCLSSRSNKFSYFRFQQRSSRTTQSCLHVWWNNTARAGFNIQSLLCEYIFQLLGGKWKRIGADRPVSDEGVLNVTVWIAGWCSPASLYT